MRIFFFVLFVYLLVPVIPVFRLLFSGNQALRFSSTL